MNRISRDTGPSRGPFISLRGIVKFLKAYACASAVFIATILAVYLISGGVTGAMKRNDRDKALLSVTHKPVRDLETVTEPRAYEKTVQTWIVPPHEKLLSPISWLKYSENCILSGRINAMKYAGMVPGDWKMSDFIGRLEGFDFAAKWGLHHGKNHLTDKLLDEINERINGGSAVKYKWVSISSIDELIYLAKKGHHVFIYTQVWMGPSKRYPKPVLYNNMNFAHACTVTGIKSYDPAEDVIEFDIHETLPLSVLTLTPVYSRVTKKGVNIFGRQSVPYIIGHGEYSRSGYIVMDRGGGGKMPVGRDDKTGGKNI